RTPAKRLRAAESDPRHPAAQAQAHVLQYAEEEALQRSCLACQRPGTRVRFTIFQESRKGQRKVNQDRLAYTYSRDTLLLVLADGVGGHAGGEIATCRGCRCTRAD